MKDLTAAQLEETWNEMETMPDDRLDELIALMSDQQPYLVDYLIVDNVTEFSEDEKDGVFYLGLLMWYVFYKFYSPLPVIDEELIERCEDDNFELAELETEEGDDEAVSEINAFAVDCVLSFKDELEMNDENTSLMMTIVKTVVDCLSAE